MESNYDKKALVNNDKYNGLRILAKYIVKNRLLNELDILEFNNVHQCINEILMENQYYKYLIEIQKIIKDKLKYDSHVYDENTYKRKILEKYFNNIYSKYFTLKIPIINFCYDDFDEEVEKVYFIDEEDIPIEFKIFLHEYRINPSINLQIYPPDFILDIIKTNRTILVDYFNTINEDKHGKMVFLIPLIYLKYSKSHYLGFTNVNILCFINISENDEKILFEAPERQNRFIKISLEIEDSNIVHYKKLQKYVLDAQISVSGVDPNKRMMDYCYPEDILKDCQTFYQILDKL